MNGVVFVYMRQDGESRRGGGVRGEYGKFVQDHLKSSGVQNSSVTVITYLFYTMYLINGSFSDGCLTVVYNCYWIITICVGYFLEFLMYGQNVDNMLKKGALNLQLIILCILYFY